MKKYINLFLLLIMSSSLLFVSCDDDDSNNDTDDDNHDSTEVEYFAMPLGSFRIMMNTDSDNAVNYDSVAVTSTETLKDSIEATVLTTYSSETDGNFGETGTNNYYNHEDGQLFVNADFFTAQTTALSEIVDLGLSFENWYLVADENGTSWNIFTQPLQDKEINYANTYILSITGDFTIDGKNDGLEDITVGGNIYSALKMTFTIGMTDADATYNNLLGKLNLNTEITNYFVDGIGIVKTVTSGANVNYTINGVPVPLIDQEIIGGSTTEMLRTNLPLLED